MYALLGARGQVALPGLLLLLRWYLGPRAACMVSFNTPITNIKRPHIEVECLAIEELQVRTHALDHRHPVLT